MNQNEIFTRIVDQDKAVRFLMTKQAGFWKNVGKGAGKMGLGALLAVAGKEGLDSYKEYFRPEQQGGGVTVNITPADQEGSGYRATQETDAGNITATPEADASSETPSTTEAPKPQKSQKRTKPTSETTAPATESNEDSPEKGKDTDNKGWSWDATKEWLRDENNQWSLGAGAAGGLGLYGALGYVPGFNKRKNRLLRALISVAGGAGIGYGVNSVLKS